MFTPLEGGLQLLMRTDPFRELDRLPSSLGTAARPAAMPIDAYRHGDTFVVDLDLPGVSPTRSRSPSNATF